MKSHLIVLSLLVACAGVPRVEPDLVDAFPATGRRWVFEAENEIVIALDRLDAARDHLASLDQERTRIRGAGRKDETSAARLTWLAASIAAAEGHAEVAEIHVDCTRRALELTKARAAKNFNLPVEEGFAGPFEASYIACGEREQRAKTAAEANARVATAAKQDWRNVRHAHRERTGGHDLGLWID